MAKKISNIAILYLQLLPGPNDTFQAECLEIAYKIPFNFMKKIGWVVTQTTNH